MKKSIRYILLTAIVLLLTIVTQIGGLIFLFSIFINKKFNLKYKFNVFITFIFLYFAITFLFLYFAITFLLIPILAPLFGRERIINTDKIKPVNYFTILLNRNYVVPELNDFLKSVSRDLKSQNAKFEIQYLDANFPFLDGFPLLPHLSHKNGKKLDISLIYEKENAEITNLKKSNSGYGVFENPSNSEFDQTSFCKDRGYFQYEYSKYLTFGRINENLIFSEKATKQLILSILNQENLDKMFIEPHLKKRMNLIDNRIKFQGCKAVRHDDHIHLQIK